MLMRFDPFKELDRLTQQSWAGTRAPAMPIDAYRHGDHFTIHFDLPGIDPTSIDLTVEKNVLSVTAERSWQRPEGVDVVVAERLYGKFSRQLFLGEGLDTDGIEATYDNGVLTVRIPVAEKAKPRKVAIATGGSEAQAIDARSTQVESSNGKEPVGASA